MSEDEQRSVERPIDSDLADDVQRLNGNVNAFGRRLERMAQEVEELRQRVEQLEHVNDRLVTDLPTQKRSKAEKMFAILERVADQAGANARRGSIGRAEAAGAADCSKRHALNLFDDLDEQFPSCTKNTAKAQAEETRLDVEFGEDGPAAFVETVREDFVEVDR